MICGALHNSDAWWPSAASAKDPAQAGSELQRKARIRVTACTRTGQNLRIFLDQQTPPKNAGFGSVLAQQAAISPVGNGSNYIFFNLNFIEPTI